MGRMPTSGRRVGPAGIACLAVLLTPASLCLPAGAATPGVWEQVAASTSEVPPPAPTSPPKPVADLLPSYVGLGWRPDSVTERNQGTDGTQTSGSGWRLGNTRLDAAVRLGPVLATGAYDSLWYPTDRSDTGQHFSRWQHQGLLGLLLAGNWGPQLAGGIGVAGMAQNITVFNPPPSDRPADYLDVTTWRVSVGPYGMLGIVPVRDWPLSLDARVGWMPVGWQLSDPTDQDLHGLWSLHADAGVRWFLTPHFALDCRYLFDQWRSTGYSQVSHGLTTGLAAIF